MVTTNFYLDKKNYRKEAIIFMYFRYNKKLLKYNTGLTILATQWNKKKHRPYATCKHQESYNRILDNLRVEVNDTYYELRGDLKREPFPKELKTALNEKLNTDSTKSQPALHKFIKQFIEDSRKAKKEGIIKVYFTTWNHLKGYEKENSIKLNFNSINTAFNQSFTSYLFNLGLANNTVGKYIKTLKTFLNSATEQGLNKNLSFKKFKVFKKPTEYAIYLDETELDKLFNLDLSENKRLEKVRDLFIVACWTGLRYSDFSKLTADNMSEKKGVEVINVVTQKTHEPVYVPVHYHTKEIFKKYNGKFPEAITIQKMNKYLKELGKLAGINEPVEKVIIRNNKNDKSILPKYELISTHTARRSFATNLILTGDLSVKSVMQITGHKQVKTFLGYVRTTKLENTLKVSEHRIFNKKEEAVK